MKWYHFIIIGVSSPASVAPPRPTIMRALHCGGKRLIGIVEASPKGQNAIFAALQLEEGDAVAKPIIHLAYGRFF